MKRHIERVIQLYFLDETRESMENILFTENQLWDFNYGDDANLAPHPTRTLKLSEVDVVDDTYPLRTLEAEELSNEGTITWLKHLFREQLAQGDHTLAEILVFVYGDLGTIKAIHGTKSHMAEELHDTDSLKYVIPALGVFHLRKRLLELIIKEFRAKDCPDFAHLDPMIKKVNMKGFKDDKCEHFRQVEDLVLLSYRSLVSACIVEYLPKPRAESDDLTATERRDHAAMQMMDMGRDETRAKVVEHVYHAMFNPLSEYVQKKEHFPESPPCNEQMIQASQLMRLGGLYIELKDTIRFGRVGKLPSLIRLLLPWFAGSGNGASIYTRELAAFLLQQKYMDPNTFDSMLDNLLRPAKLSGWIEADMACEHLVRIQKDIYKARGGSFRWEKLIKYSSLISRILYNAKVAFSFGHLSVDKIKKRGEHYDKTQVPDILNIMEEILNSGLLRLDAPKKANVENNDLWGVGIQSLQTYDIPKLKAYLLGKDLGDEPDNESSPSWDLRGAVDGDPDTIEDVELFEDREESIEPTFAEIQRQEAAGRLEALRRQGETSGVIRPARTGHRPQ